MNHNVIKFPLRTKRTPILTLGGRTKENLFFLMPDRAMIWEDKCELVKKLVSQH
jgi:hypothetical protein